MANIKITDLDALTAVDGADLVEVVDDVAGTATSKKMTHKNLLLYNQYKGGDIASASPLVVDTDGNYFDVTGTTGFAAMTVAANRFFVLQFDGALTMTHHATNLDLPGEKNITTAAGDIGVFFSTGANTVQCISYTKADGTPVAMVGQNLLTNSGFGVWSNSTLENVGSAILDDDAADDDTGDWTVVDNLTFDTDHYEWDWNDANDTCYINNGASLTAGKLYKISVNIKDGTASSQQFQLWMNDGAEQVSLTKTTTSSFVTHTFVFECATTLATSDIGLKGITDAAGNNIEFKAFTLYEVTPGCVAADTLACDGWVKDNTADIYRQHDDSTYTKDGSFYSLKVVTAGASLQMYKSNQTDDVWLSKINGRTLTLGAWVYASDASHVKVEIYNGSSYDGSDYHSGGSSWEWLEVTSTIATDNTVGKVGFRFELSGKTCYISQPMLVFGSSIGEGNYHPIPGERIFFEAEIQSNTLQASGWSDVASTLLNVEADSNGKIPKGVKALNAMSACIDSDSAATLTYFALDPIAANTASNYVNCPHGKANDTQSIHGGIAICDANGDVYYQIEASGANTFDIGIFRYTGCILR